MFLFLFVFVFVPVILFYILFLSRFVVFGDQKWGDLGGLHSNKSRPELRVSRLTARNAIRVATRIVMFLVWPRPELSCVVTRSETISGYRNYMPRTLPKKGQQCSTSVMFKLYWIQSITRQRQYSPFLTAINSHRQVLKDIVYGRVAGLGRLSAGAKMAMKPFVKREFTIFATNALFLRVISNFRI